MDLCSRQFNFFVEASTLLYCLTLFTFVVVGLFLFVQSVYSFFEKQKIPRGPLPSPPFGNLKDVIFKRVNVNIHLWKYYNRFRRKKYWFGGLYILFKPLVMILDPYLVYTVLTDNNHFEDIDDDISEENASAIYDDAILVEFLKKYDALEDKFLNTIDSATSIYDFYVKASTHLIGISPLEFSTLEKKDHPRHQSTFSYYLSLSYPQLCQTFNINSNYGNTGLTNLLRKELERRKKNDIRKTDLLNNVSNANELNTDAYIKHISEFFFDSLEFGQSLTQFCLYELCENEDTQQELIGELRRFRKDNDVITRDNIAKLTLLDAIIKETLRKYPPHASIIRRCHKDYKNEKYRLNLLKECLTVVSVFGIHHDQLNFPNPEQFDPDRFYVENEKYMKSYSFIPFGVGAKSTIGMKFIVLQLKLCILSILSRYKVTLKSSSNLVYDPKKLTISPSSPLIFHFELL